jgi:hypothetical protein
MRPKNTKKSIESIENVDLFLQFLADSGYFNILSIDEKKIEIETRTEDENTEEDAEFENNSTYYCILKIPNFEIKQHIRNVCCSKALTIICKYKLKAGFIKRYLSALKFVLESRSETAFVDLANAVLVLFSESPQRIRNEKELHHVLYTLAYNSRCFVTRGEVQIKKK